MSVEPGGAASRMEGPLNILEIHNAYEKATRESRRPSALDEFSARMRICVSEAAEAGEQLTVGDMLLLAGNSPVNSDTWSKWANRARQSSPSAPAHS
jgi:hypothetical protein